LPVPPYSHPRAFTVNPDKDILDTIKNLVTFTWGHSDLSVMDPFSGGGSIPFESLRYGFKTIANELNPVASVILKATLDYPFRFGPSLGQDISHYGKILVDKVRARLDSFFPLEDGENIHAYLWARTVACPYTGKPIPLSPNWWVLKPKTGPPIAVEPRYDPAYSQARFRIVKGIDACARTNPEKGTVKGGKGISPWEHGQIVSGDYIKAEAQAGRLGEQLFAVAIKRKEGFDFRPPTSADLNAFNAAEKELQVRMPVWEAKGILPTEDITKISNYDRGHKLYGMNAWKDVYSPRQLLTLCTYCF
jgi:adenine-specific DNA methylase